MSVERRRMVDTKVPVTSPVEKGWIETIKDKFNFDNLTQKFDLSKDKILTLLAYLGVGFLVGFLIKKYFRYVFVLALIITGVYLLQRTGAITITVDWIRMNEVFGIKAMPQVDGSMFAVYWEWIKANLAVSVSFVLGFIIGWKVS